MYIKWFKDIDKSQIAEVGGKGANLGELVRAGIPVPDGFVVTARAYFDFLKQAKIAPLIQKLLNRLNPEDNKALNVAAQTLQRAILAASMPAKIGQEIGQAYQELGGGEMAVRSSATAEDLPTASFAGQQETFLNVEGEDAILRAVQKCWASLFTSRAIYYRIINKFDHLKVGLASPVQKMVESEKSGVMFTINPLTNDQKQLVIEAGFGLGEAIVSGSITPDYYTVDKQNLDITNKQINTQEWEIVKATNPTLDQLNIHRQLPPERGQSQKLTDEEIITIAKLGLKIEKHYDFPQDTEWAIEAGKIYFVQSRPITTYKKPVKAKIEVKGEGALMSSPPTTNYQLPTTISAEPLLKGIAASMGVASGLVRIIHSPQEISLVQKGEVLVTEMTTPDFVPAMKRAAAIITDTGGQTSHAAIVSREMGVPCIVGTGQATHILKTSQRVTVDGRQGLVFAGNLAEAPVKESVVANHSFQLREEIPVTGTKVYLNLGEPEKAEEVAQLPVDGVGLLRAEFIVANLGQHPKSLVESGQKNKYLVALKDGVGRIARAFNPRPVIYRATDFKTNEYRGLAGGEKYEPQENNPMLGWRGASRYLSEPEMFKIELTALLELRRSGLDNIHLMIPFVRTLEEMIQIKELINQTDLTQDPDFKLYLMCEVPATVILAKEFCRLGVAGFSIGSNDLTQLILGIDRDNERLAGEFDERNEAVVRAIREVIRVCRSEGVTVSVCGQAPSVYPEFTEMLVRAGITSVSVTPDVALSTRKLIASVEKRMLLDHLRKI